MRQHNMQAFQQYQHAIQTPHPQTGVYQPAAHNPVGSSSHACSCADGALDMRSAGDEDFLSWRHLG